MEYPVDAEIGRDLSLAWRGDSVSDAAQRATRGVPGDVNSDLFQPGGDNVTPDDYILLNTGDAVTVLGPPEAARVIQDGDPTNGGANTEPRALVPIIPFGATGFPSQRYYTRSDWIDYSAAPDASGKNLPVSATSGTYVDESGAVVAGNGSKSILVPALLLLALFAAAIYAGR